MTHPMSKHDFDKLEAQHYQIHAGVDRCFKDGEKYPCRTKKLLDAYQAMNRRLYPGQGEGYANEVERQRYVIEELQRILDTRSAEVARLTEIVTSYGMVLH